MDALGSSQVKMVDQIDVDPSMQKFYLHMRITSLLSWTYQFYLSTMGEPSGAIPLKTVKI